MRRRDFIKGSAILGMSIAAHRLVGASGMYHEKTSRKVYRILNSKGVNVGTLPVIRAFAGDHTDYVSPYVLFDEFGPVNILAGQDALKVDAHPHAGVTPTTYFLEGSGHHKDSLNYDFQIGKGDFMMFSSGRGAIHMEESGQVLKEKGGIIHGFQIWLNTPSKYKFDAPSTTVYNKKQMTSYSQEGVDVNVVLGSLHGMCSNIETLSPAFYFHVRMDADTRFDIPVDPTHNAFIYLTSGELELADAKALKEEQVVLYQRGGDTVELYAKERAEFLVLGGEPLDEVVFSYGPFVMNNREQINKCIRDYQEGRMGDPAVVNR